MIMESTASQGLSSANKATFLVCVSDQQESEIALRYACRRAKNRGAQLAILHVVEPADFEGLIPVGDVIRQEKEAEAQELLHRMADIATQEMQSRPILLLKDGQIGSAILQSCKENADINTVVLGLRHDSQRGPKLAAWLTSKMGEEMLVPLMLVPGNLTEAQIDMLF